MSRAGLYRITPAAFPILVIAANLPDVDTISLLGGTLNYFHWHRHLTHSLFLAPFLAFTLAALVRKFQPGTQLFQATALALCGILSHLALDLTNDYGVRVFLPFRDTWIHWDLTPVVDFWIWSFLLAALAGPFLSGLVGSEMSSSRSGGNGRGFAIAALVLLVAYDGGRALIHRRVVTMLEAREYDNAAPVRTAAFPASANPFHWRGIAETASAYYVYDIHIPGVFDPSGGRSVAKVESSAALEAANKTEAFRIFRGFAAYPWYQVDPPDEANGTQQIQLLDLRFECSTTALIDRAGKVKSSEFRFRPATER